MTGQLISLVLMQLKTIPPNSNEENQLDLSYISKGLLSISMKSLTICQNFLSEFVLHIERYFLQFHLKVSHHEDVSFPAQQKR
jgi:hypothetical protein